MHSLSQAVTLPFLAAALFVASSSGCNRDGARISINAGDHIYVTVSEVGLLGPTRPDGQAPDVLYTAKRGQTLVAAETTTDSNALLIEVPESSSPNGKVVGRVRTSSVRLTHPRYLPIEILLIGLLVVGSVVWQVKLCEKDSSSWYGWDDFADYPKRLRVPLGVGFITMVGAIGYVIVTMVQGDGERMLLGFFVFLRAIVFSVVLAFKAYIGPLFTAFVLGTEIYFLFEYKSFHAIPIVSALVDWLFDFAPEWLGATYIALTAAYCFCSSVWESFFDS